MVCFSASGFVSIIWGDIFTHWLLACLQSELEIEPRYPLFGGWKTTFVIGYGLPLQDFLFESSDGQHYLNFTFGCPLLETVVDRLTIKVSTLIISNFVIVCLLEHWGISSYMLASFCKIVPCYWVYHCILSSVCHSLEFLCVCGHSWYAFLVSLPCTYDNSCNWKLPLKNVINSIVMYCVHNFKTHGCVCMQ